MPKHKYNGPSILRIYTVTRQTEHPGLQVGRPFTDEESARQHFDIAEAPCTLKATYPSGTSEILDYKYVDDNGVVLYGRIWDEEDSDEQSDDFADLGDFDDL